MKFAFLIMSSHEIDSREERAAICDGEFSIISVNDMLHTLLSRMVFSRRLSADFPSKNLCNHFDIKKLVC